MSTVARNPLPSGRYEVDLYTPTDSATSVRDGVPIFNHWRETNAERVRVLHAECWNTSPRRTRVLFEVRARPGAWPFGQLGKPERVAEVGAVSFAEIAAFLFNPLGSLEESIAAAAGTFVTDQLSAFAAPELQELRNAIIITRANIAVIRALLEGVRNHTVPDPAAAITECRRLIKQSLELLVHAVAGLAAVDFPRRITQKLIDDLRALEKSIRDAPAKALQFLEDEAGLIARDVGVPFAVSTGGLVALGVAAYFLFSGKRNKDTGHIALLGAAALVLGGAQLVDNIEHPAPLPKFK